MIKEYNGVVFDDYSTSGGEWSQVCGKHAKCFNKSALSECAGAPICGVEGCNNVADFYIDFPVEVQNVGG